MQDIELSLAVSKASNHTIIKNVVSVQLDVPINSSVLPWYIGDSDIIEDTDVLSFNDVFLTVKEHPKTLLKRIATELKDMFPKVVIGARIKYLDLAPVETLIGDVIFN